MAFVAVINFSLTISALTSKATRGVLIGLLLFFVGTILAGNVDYQEASTSLIGLVGLHPVAALSFGLQEISFLEDRGVGLTADTADSSDYPSGYTFSDTLSERLSHSCSGEVRLAGHF